MRHFGLKIICSLFLAALLSVPALADTPTQRGPANPGTINYVEGQVSIDSQPLGANSEGSAMLEPEQTLTTQNGKAEVLLTPGVVARVGDDSAMKMISPDLTNTEVVVENGEAMVEVAEIHPENNLMVDVGGARIQLQKTGLYDFDAGHSQFRVIDGQAMVQTDDKRVKVKGGHDLALNVPTVKEEKFDKKAFEAGDPLYRWSSLRSAYLAEANVDQAPSYLGYGAAGWDGWGWGGWGPGWIGTGWYWNPWFSCYTFIPGDGVFYSPFGWGFYSPGWAYEAPIHFGGRYYHHFGPHINAWGPGMHYTPGIRGGGFGNGFRAGSGGYHGGGVFGYRGGARGFNGGGFHGGARGGGFHGGGGGFHGRGFGGGMHGGGFGGGGHGGGGR